MGFEKVTLDKVEKILDGAGTAYFFNFSLIVECEELKARSVFHALTRDMGLGRVQVSKAGPEYIYDFVA